MLTHTGCGGRVIIDPEMRIMSNISDDPDLIGLMCAKCSKRLGVVADEIEEAEYADSSRVN